MVLSLLISWGWFIFILTRTGLERLGRLAYHKEGEVGENGLGSAAMSWVENPVR